MLSHLNQEASSGKQAETMTWINIFRDFYQHHSEHNVAEFIKRLPAWEAKSTTGNVSICVNVKFKVQLIYLFIFLKTTTTTLCYISSKADKYNMFSTKLQLSLQGHKNKQNKRRRTDSPAHFHFHSVQWGNEVWFEWFCDVTHQCHLLKRTMD